MSVGWFALFVVVGAVEAASTFATAVARVGEANGSFHGWAQPPLASAAAQRDIVISNVFRIANVRAVGPVSG
ncbi:MAG TPA: hypothetical protein VJ828_18140 [Lacipirellulaceae bacterium]|nr:hypothetical protein [Lacipirellulaceae bacterium]